MSNVLMADFLTIPSLLELDSEAAPSCLTLILKNAHTIFLCYFVASLTDS